MKKIILMTIFTLFATGCSVNHGSFTAISNKLVNTKDFNIEKKENIKRKRAVGESVEHVIFGIGTGKATLNDALNDVFEKTDSDLLTDANVREWGWTTIIYGQRGWTVEGDAVKTRKN